MPNVIGVMYKKSKSDEFSSREYSYYVKDDIDLKLDDVVKAPTANGWSLAKVSRLNIPESEIEKIKKYMRTIETPALTQEEIEASNQPQKINRVEERN